MAPWEGVPLAPRHWPGRDKVLALAAVLKMVCGREFEVAIRSPERNGKRTIAKYMDLNEATQRLTYFRFKDYYDLHIQWKSK